MSTVVGTSAAVSGALASVAAALVAGASLVAGAAVSAGALVAARAVVAAGGAASVTVVVDSLSPPQPVAATRARHGRIRNRRITSPY